MPQGNAHVFPSGIWVYDPSTSSRLKLFRKSLTQLGVLIAGIVAYQAYRSLSYKYTYTNFIGKTISLGKVTVLDHEPLTVEQVDQLKEKQKQEKLNRLVMKKD